MRFPLLIFLLAFFGLSLSVRLGIFLAQRLRILDDKEVREDFAVVQAATLTLLGILIGFNFSMSVSRYDQRKNCEEEESNAIGTEYLRLDLLPPADAATAKELLRKYLDQRIRFYVVNDSSRLVEINRNTEQLQAGLWSTVRHGVAGQPAATVVLTVSGLNDALNSRGYTEAAWLNRIPVAAWFLIGAVALFACLLLGVGAHKANRLLILVLPFVTSIAFFLIADLDSPRRGMIHVHPQNMESLSESLKAQAR